MCIIKIFVTEMIAKGIFVSAVSHKLIQYLKTREWNERLCDVFCVIRIWKHFLTYDIPKFALREYKVDCSL